MFGNVPFSSQYADIGEHQWRARGCGIASLKMIMDFWHAKNPANRTDTLDMLLRTGLDAGAYQEGIGWTHRGLAGLAISYGYDSFNVDLAPKSPTPKSPEEAWGALADEAVHGPVMVSVWRHMEPVPAGGHIVVVTGYDGELVHYNDPIEMSEAEGRKALALRSFLPLYKQRYIAVRSREN